MPRAAAGALAAWFVLVAAAGLPGTLRIAGLLNPRHRDAPVFRLLRCHASRADCAADFRDQAAR